jgi:hypothetical protein
MYNPKILKRPPSMKSLKQIDRINKIHSLISSQKTGTPDTFAKQLYLSRRQMYNELEFFKNLNAQIKYCKKKETFYYTTKFEFSFSYAMIAISDEDAISITGGINLQNSNSICKFYTIF